jgi:uncharacterized metal-binding protein
LTKPWEKPEKIKMPELPSKKVGIVTCSGEELPEGTITRLAALRVLEQLRPSQTVTICLPLFLAGGEGDRAFAKFYPTIAIDGCAKRCAYHGTARYSNEPAASIVITDLEEKYGLEKPEGLRLLNNAGKEAVDVAADELAQQVDAILKKSWGRTDGQFKQENPDDQSEKSPELTCSCGNGIPIQKVTVGDKEMTIAGLPLIFENFLEQKKSPSPAVLNELMETIKIYNQIGQGLEPLLRVEIENLYASFYQKEIK